LKTIVLQFRVLASAAGPNTEALLTSAFEKTRDLFDSLGIKVTLGTAPQYVIDVADGGLPIPNDIGAQSNAINRLRQSYRNVAGAQDVCVYVVQVDTADGFTVPDGPDLVLDVDRIGCGWVLGHELGHILGANTLNGDHDPSSKRLMFPWPCSIFKPPPNFGPKAKSDYGSSPYCQ